MSYLMRWLSSWFRLMCWNSCCKQSLKTDNPDQKSVAFHIPLEERNSRISNKIWINSSRNLFFCLQMALLKKPKSNQKSVVLFSKTFAKLYFSLLIFSTWFCTYLSFGLRHKNLGLENDTRLLENYIVAYFSG